MNDRELLGFAAKAVGYVIDDYAGDDSNAAWVYPVGSLKNDDGEFPGFKWTPLTNDGDVLRLAVRLGGTLVISLHHRFVIFNDIQISYDESKFGGACDANNAVRRAIVQAAAEIGKAMEIKNE